MRERVHGVEVAGPAGRLEALLHVDQDADPKGIAVVCHPHPLFGGTMHNKVVHRIDRALFRAGRAVLRFNFRGVGASLGRHDGNGAEAGDARAALDHLAGLYPGKGAILAGFSFGAAQAVAAGAKDARVAALVLAGAGAGATLTPPESVEKPVLVVHGTEDTVSPLSAVEDWYARLPAKELALIEGASHFFDAHLDALESAVHDWALRLP